MADYFKCKKCGLVSNAAGIGSHFKASGHGPQCIRVDKPTEPKPRERFRKIKVVGDERTKKKVPA